jgi:hypothetical protein
MKQKLFFLAVLCSIMAVKAQTNVFPANGNVGIGTTNPQAKLDVISPDGGLSVSASNLDPNGHYPLSVLKNSTRLLLGWNYSGGGGEQDFFSNRGAGSTGGFSFYDYGNNEAIIQLMTLQGNGSVGIGTTTPSTKTHICGTLTIDPNGIANNYSEGIRIGNASNGYSLVQFGVNTTQAVGQQTNQWWAGKDGIDNGFTIYGNTCNNALHISPNGNTGIGTTNPQSKLDVQGDIYINSGIDDNHIYWGRHNLTMGTPAGDYAHNVLSLKPGGASQGKLVSVFQMFNAPSESQHDLKVVIQTDGNSFFNGGSVGIGTTTPDQKLTVKGKIHAEEVIVDLNVPVADYVFAKDYSLMPLHKVEQYVHQNSHLPDIPSATEIKEQGLSMGEMQNKLLKKIEELTLYVIEQNKSKEELEAKYNELVKKVDALIENKQ